MIKRIITDIDGSMTDGTVLYNEVGIKHRSYSVIDGKGIAIAQSKGYEVIAITSSKCFSISKRCDDLKIQKYYMGVEDKHKHLSIMLGKEYFLDSAYFGDDINDRKPMKKCSFVGCPQNAIQSIKDNADYVCNNFGGNGALREFIMLVISKHDIITE